MKIKNAGGQPPLDEDDIKSTVTGQADFKSETPKPTRPTKGAGVAATTKDVAKGGDIRRERSAGEPAKASKRSSGKNTRKEKSVATKKNGKQVRPEQKRVDDAQLKGMLQTGIKEGKVDSATGAIKFIRGKHASAAGKRIRTVFASLTKKRASGKRQVA